MVPGRGCSWVCVGAGACVVSDKDKRGEAGSTAKAGSKVSTHPATRCNAPAPVCVCMAVGGVLACAVVQVCWSVLRASQFWWLRQCLCPAVGVCVACGATCLSSLTLVTRGIAPCLARARMQGSICCQMLITAECPGPHEHSTMTTLAKASTHTHVHTAAAPHTHPCVRQDCGLMHRFIAQPLRT